MKDIFRLVILAAAACATLPAAAEEDFAFTYRGRITAPDALPEALDVTYSLYRSDDDTVPVWTQTKTERPSASGVFQSVLEGDGLQAAFEEQEARFLGIRLGGTNAVEQFPRQQILATPLADFADVVERASASPSFEDAAVGTLSAGMLSAGTLTVTDTLTLSDGVNLTLADVTVGENTTLTVKEPTNGTVSLFSGPPHEYAIGTNGLIKAETELFNGAEMKGGLLVFSTSDSDYWDRDYAVPGATVPVAPGVVKVPVPIQGPAKFWFYEFGN